MMRSPARILCLLLMTLPLVAQQPTSATPAVVPSSAAPADSFQVGGAVIHALDGQPLADVEVALKPIGKPDDLQTTLTDANGRFLFRGVAEGKYVLSGQRQGFPKQKLDEHGPLSTAVAVGPEKKSEGLVFRLRPFGSISGRIIDDQDDPVRGASVMLFCRNLEESPHVINHLRDISTDDQGSYHFGHLPAGEYYVAVSAKPWYAISENDPRGGRSVTPASAAEISALDVAYPTTYYPQVTEPEQASPIRLNWGDRLSANIMLRAVPALHLRLASQASAPSQEIDEAILKQTLLGGAEILLETPSAKTGRNSIEISGIAPGRYDLSVGIGNEEREVGVSSTRHQTLNLFGSSELDPLHGAELGIIRGKLVLEERPAPDSDFRRLSLEFRNRESGQRYDVPVSARGDFDVPEIHPGRYDVALLNSADFVLRSISATGAKVAGTSIELSGNERVNLTLIASQGTGRVEGVVLCGNRPLAGAMVMLVPRDPANNLSLFRRGQSGSDGSFELIAVPPDSYTVLAVEDGWELEWSSPSFLESHLSQGQIVEVKSGSKLSLSITCPSLHGRVPARVAAVGGRQN